MFVSRRLAGLCVAARGVRAAAGSGSGSRAAGPGRVWHRQPCVTATRAHSGARTGGTQRSAGCIVDPKLEEEFVFLDCTELQEEKEESLFSPAPSTPPRKPSPSPLHFEAQKQQRALERRLQVVDGVPEREPQPDALIQFHDVDFPLDESLVKTTRKKKTSKGEHKVVGTPDADEPVSDTCCSGCGAVLHCTAADFPGYVPSEKYKALLGQERLHAATCQRCHLLTHHHKALHLQMSKDDYRDIVRQIKPKKALVLLIVDLLDLPDSIVPDLPELVGRNKHIVVLGNKIDLLPGDSPNYLQQIKRQLSQYCARAGMSEQVSDVHLISAKTGYGVEGLISSLQGAWRYKGDVYLVGSTNAGKSTLFNTLLESDYCKSKATDIVHKATISPWPGTTLNLLKFPIINPTPHRMFKRQERLKEAHRQTEEELSPEELRRLKAFSKQGYLVGRVGRTFRSEGSRRNVIEFDPDSLAEGEYEEEGGRGGAPATASTQATKIEFSHNELKDAHWLYDTPGIMKERDILNLLNEQEVGLVVPTHAIVPRTFVLKPGMSLFLGALARIDVLEGEKSCWLSVIASDQIPVHITSTERADAVYHKHAGHKLLGVPVGGSERMKEFPALVPQEFRLEGRGYLQAAADIKLSSAGWVAVTAVEGDQVLLRVHGPDAAGFCLRTSPLLPGVVTLKGERLRKSAAYKAVKPAGLLDVGMSARAAQRLTGKKKKN
ncbi:nitric oxide-associated protein 1 [Genypterus blacodes]|uniref:nitric oxide-associated protein 1 n=1 Tax=Genypterus blacodes TaxID=154954 RepID=UPI003F7679EE